MKTFHLLFLGLAMLFSFVVKSQYTVSYPIDKSVYQRNSSGNATIPIAGHFPLAACSGYTAEYKIDKLNATNGSYNYIYQDWTTFYPSSLGVFSFTITLGTGWYYVYVRLKEDSSSDVIHSYGLKVGVGDVFVVAGQSNIAGQDVPPTAFKSSPTSPYDCVTAMNSRNDCNSKFFPLPSFFTNIYTTAEISSNGKNGWFYTDLGNKLVSSNSTPVSFFNAGFDGTSVLYWQSSISGGNTNTYCDGSEPYRMLKRSLNLFASTFGVRTVLWQQGETDNELGTSRTNYKDKLLDVIAQTRSDYNLNLQWMIAQTSYHPTHSTNSNITNAQSDVINDNTTLNKSGANTDTFGSDHRNTTDGLHFSYNSSAMVDGFEPLAEAWETAINNASLSPISPISIPAITMTKSGSNYTLSAPNGYDEYRWVYSGDRLDDYFSTSQTLYLTSSSTTGHRCFVRQGNNWVASGVVYPTVYNCYSGSRQGLAEKFEEDLGANFKVFPNPTDKEITIEFSLKKATQVRLDIVDLEGRVIQQIAAGELASNQYLYRQDLQRLSEGSYMCRLVLNELVLSKRFIKR
jgi:hypothetical protein